MESNLNDTEDFSVLGLHQDIVIFIDAKSRLPLQISGFVLGVGSVDLKLNGARVLRGSRASGQGHTDSKALQ